MSSTPVCGRRISGSSPGTLQNSKAASAAVAAAASATAAVAVAAAASAASAAAAAVTVSAAKAEKKGYTKKCWLKCGILASSAPSRT